MKNRSVLPSILIIAIMLTSGCVRTAPNAVVPGADDPTMQAIFGPLTETAAPEASETSEASPTETSASDENDETNLATDEATPTSPSLETATPEATQDQSETPTEPPFVTATGTPLPTNTFTPGPSPTNTSTPTPDLTKYDPARIYGAARMDKKFLAVTNWKSFTGGLPDTENIRITIDENTNDMTVTGKYANYKTWWFSSGVVQNMFIQISVKTSDICQDKSAYGLIVNGPTREATPTTGSYGYITLLSCDGNAFMERLDATKDYDGSPLYAATNLFWWTKSDSIKTGANQTNTLGLLVKDGILTVYINGDYFYTIQDDTYKEGRFGIYVNSGETANFTYTVTDFGVWRVD